MQYPSSFVVHCHTSVLLQPRGRYTAWVQLINRYRLSSSKGARQMRAVISMDSANQQQLRLALLPVRTGSSLYHTNTTSILTQEQHIKPSCCQRETQWDDRSKSSQIFLGPKATTSYTKDTQGYLIKRRMISEILNCQANVSEHKLKGGQILQAVSKASA